MIWIFIYFLPMLLLIILIKTKTTFKIQKKRQTWLYFIEIYYISLFFTMLTTKVTDGYFFLWNGKPQYEIILERFFTSFAIYQVWILVTRNLNSSSDIDSFITLKSLLNKIIIALEADNTSLATSIKSNFLDILSKNEQVILNDECLKIIESVKDDTFNNKDALTKLKIEVTNIELAIESLSLTWNQSFLLNLFK